MRTLSVREVAGALGLTKRAVMYRLESGKLKGTRVTNGHGQEEWRVYPNKEVLQAVQAKGGSVDSSGQLNFNPSDIVDSIVVEGIEAEDNQDFEGAEEIKTSDLERLLEVFREQFAPEVMAEKIVKPLMNKIEAQQELIFEQRQELSDKDRQLRLLPDLQKQAELRAQEVELKHVENEALKKQIDAIIAEQATLQTQVEALKQTWWRKLFAPGKSSD